MKLFLTSLVFSVASANLSTVKTIAELAKVVKEYNATVVEFYAPWCGHCKKLDPIYKAAAKETTEMMIQVDCVDSPEICREITPDGIQGYPTLMGFTKWGQVPKDAAPYDGPRERENLLAFVKTLSRPPFTLVESEKTDADNVENAVGKASAITAFIKDEADIITFKKLAKAFFFKAPSASFYYVTDEAISKALNGTVPSLKINKAFDEPELRFEEKFEEKAITEFVEQNITPIMEDLAPENFQRLVDSGKPLGYYFIDSEDQRKPEMQALAKKYKASVNLVYISAKDFGNHAETCGLLSEWPCFGIVKYGTGATKWPIRKKSPSLKEIEDTIEGVINNTLDPYIKSAEVPTTNDESVKVIVSTEFNKFVMDTTKDVFVELYTGWCGHCKNLAPIWKQLGDNYANATNVVIAKMNCEENDLPIFAADTPKESNPSLFFESSFPTLLLVRAGDNKVFAYGAERSLPALSAFIEENAVNKGQGVIVEDAEDDEEDEDEDDHEEL